MGESTPAQFAAKLIRVGEAVKADDDRALTARALVTKQYILLAAEGRTRQAQPSWVQFVIHDGVAAVRLRGGFAYLTELGSHKAPSGWEETPKRATARRRRAALRKGTTLEEHEALNTPWGPKASVHHPALRARHFFDEGVRASRTPGRNAYQKVIDETITAALR